MTVDDLGAYNERADVDRLIAAVERVVAGAVQGRYAQGPDGQWVPVGYREPQPGTRDPAPEPVAAGM